MTIKASAQIYAQVGIFMSWRKTHYFRHEGEPEAHLPVTYADLEHATHSGLDWAPADLTEA